MKRNRVLTFFTLLCGLLFHGCNSEEDDVGELVDLPVVTLSAYSGDEGDFSTRTVMNSSGDLLWQVTDTVSVNGRKCTAVEVLDEGANAKFTVAAAAPYYVMYPAYKDMIYNSSAHTYTFNFPSSQPYNNNTSFASGVNPSVATGETEDLYFYNVCGVLKAQFKVQLTGIKKVRFLSAGEAVAGLATANPTEKTLQITGSTQSMDVVFSSPQTLRYSTTVTVRWVLPVGNYAAGWTIQLLDEGGSVITEKVVTDKPFTVERSQVKSIGLFTYISGSGEDYGNNGNHEDMGYDPDYFNFDDGSHEDVEPGSTTTPNGSNHETVITGNMGIPGTSNHEGMAIGTNYWFSGTGNHEGVTPGGTTVPNGSNQETVTPGSTNMPGTSNHEGMAIGTDYWFGSGNTGGSHEGVTPGGTTVPNGSNQETVTPGSTNMPGTSNHEGMAIGTDYWFGSGTGNHEGVTPGGTTVPNGSNQETVTPGSTNMPGTSNHEGMGTSTNGYEFGSGSTGSSHEGVTPGGTTVPNGSNQETVTPGSTNMPGTGNHEGMGTSTNGYEFGSGSTGGSHEGVTPGGTTVPNGSNQETVTPGSTNMPGTGNHEGMGTSTNGYEFGNESNHEAITPEETEITPE